MTDRWVDPNQQSPINPRTPLILTTAAVVLTLGVIGTLLAVVIFAGPQASPTKTLGTISLITRNATPQDPFTKSILVAPVSISADTAAKSAALLQQLPVRADRGVRLVSGRQPQLYGTTGQTYPCDAVTLANALDVDVAAAQVWGHALGLTPQQIPFYLNTLTAVVLMADTWVTSHALTDGADHPDQTVLQAGTAVLVDPIGVPRVHCVSGAPLTPPANQSFTDFQVTGDTWDGFSAPSVLAVAYTSSGTSAAPGDFVLVDVSSGEEVSRKAGGTISLGDPLPLPDPAVMNVPAPTTTS